ncbi:hypothetical protein [Lactobacillus corticis]|uniref:Uncharacterized protein n=1 Tax=Lactobacillus corticis TaxID=2201249 RepID=A0A916QKP1_9LACO|nr:hypothetical protein [Lactobacillus corticis]GFZ27723.1 hypothetical protein LCB40_16030 [Lactobacillus corticis]
MPVDQPRISTPREDRVELTKRKKLSPLGTGIIIVINQFKVRKMNKITTLRLNADSSDEYYVGIKIKQINDWLLFEPINSDNYWDGVIWMRIDQVQEFNDKKISESHLKNLADPFNKRAMNSRLINELSLDSFVGHVITVQTSDGKEITGRLENVAKSALFISEFVNIYQREERAISVNLQDIIMVIPAEIENDLLNKWYKATNLPKSNLVEIYLHGQPQEEFFLGQILAENDHSLLLASITDTGVFDDLVVFKKADCDKIIKDDPKLPYYQFMLNAHLENKSADPQHLLDREVKLQAAKDMLAQKEPGSSIQIITKSQPDYIFGNLEGKDDTGIVVDGKHYEYSDLLAFNV